MADATVSSLRHRDVLDVASAVVIGRVDGVVFNGAHDTVAALVVGKGSKGRTILPWGRLVAIGPDAVTVDGDDALRVPADEREESAVDGDLDPVGKPVLTIEGHAGGRLDDVGFDTESGAVTAIVVDGSTRPAGDLVSVGSYVAVTRPG